MCGNGIRCIGKYVYDHGLTKKKAIRVETKGGTVGLELHPKGGKVVQVTVDMGVPRPVPRTFHVRADGASNLLRERAEGLDGFVVSMGNPHFVIPVPSTDGAPVTTTGPVIEKHADFPSKVNVEFVEILTPAHVRQRTWERGSGETWACGSGACAVGFALSSAGRTGRKVRIDLLGGTLQIEHGTDGHIYMTGPAVEVFSGEFPALSKPKSPRRRANESGPAALKGG